MEKLKLKVVRSFHNIRERHENIYEFLQSYKDIINKGTVAEFFCKEIFGLTRINKNDNFNGPDLTKKIKGKTYNFEVKTRSNKDDKFCKGHELLRTPPPFPINYTASNLYILYVFFIEKNLFPNIFLIDYKDTDKPPKKSQGDRQRVLFTTAKRKGLIKKIYPISKNKLN